MTPNTALPSPSWHTYAMGGAAWERMNRMGRHAYHSHAVDKVTGAPLCRAVKVDSLCWDDSIHAPGELPDCPKCLTAIRKRERAQKNA